VAAVISILALGACRLTTDAPKPRTLGIISGDDQSATAGSAYPNRDRDRDHLYGGPSRTHGHLAIASGGGI